MNTSGKPPASSQVMFSGTSMALPSSTTINSAWAPPPTRAMTRSPMPKRRTSEPVPITSPANSIPGMSWGYPGGAG